MTEADDSGKHLALCDAEDTHGEFVARGGERNCRVAGLHPLEVHGVTIRRGHTARSMPTTGTLPGASRRIEPPDPVGLSSPGTPKVQRAYCCVVSPSSRSPTAEDVSSLIADNIGRWR